MATPKTNPEEHLGHKPTTKILDQIQAAIKSRRGLLAFVWIGPEEAKDILTLNRDNRQRTENDIIRYANRMSNKKWKWIGQVLKIDKTWRLIDGQAELLAIILSGTKQLFHIQASLDEDAYTVVDTNRPKSVADTLRTMGFKDVNNMSSAIRNAISIGRHKRTPSTANARIPGVVVDSLEVNEWLKIKGNASSIHDALTYNRPFFYSRERLTFISFGQLSAVYFLLHKIKSDDADYFIEKLATGEINSNGKDRAIFLAREKLQRLQVRVKERPHGSREKDYRFRYIFDGWNSWRRGERPKELNPDMESPDIVKPI